ncbi:MAG TPA: hypothetical protein VMF58_08445 [Rhizomicrobium sp.]|nr:hypothetical protein [Rhizomicrobium sp.]
MLTTVAIFRDPWEAQLLRSRLEADGLAPFVQYYNHISAKWSYAYALGGVHVQVVDDEVSEAGAIIARMRAGALLAELRDEFGELDEPRCPKCGSADFRRRASIPQIIFSFGVLFLTGVPVPPVLARVCRACGSPWDPPVASTSEN